MSKSLKRARNLVVISLLAYSLVLWVSIIANAQTNVITEPQMKGISTIIQGKLLTIPNFEEMPLDVLSKYRKGFESQIRQFPQLKTKLRKATFAKLDNKLPLSSKSLLPSFLAIADNYWGHSEHTDTSIPTNQYVSGTVTCEGRNQPVAPPAGLAVSYLELSDWEGSSGKYYGKRWISGKQMVDGGCGILKSVNGGKEPAGRLVWGTDTFKIVLNEVDERTQQASFSAYMRLCANLPLGGKTCSPYFIPLPWFPIQGRNWVAIGGGSL
jgi:hypothetical protein